MTHTIIGKTKLNEVFDTLISPEFWQELCPSLKLTTDSQAHCELGGIRRPDEERCTARLEQEGYFQERTVFPEELVGRLADGVELLRGQQLIPLFLLVYDEPWAMIAASAPWIRLSLGGDYHILPDLWVWRVDTDYEDRGWQPHRDRVNVPVLDQHGKPLSLTVWLPLTQATPENGCLYILPAVHDCFYPERLERMGVERWQDIRALPASPGDLLAWNQAVMHWGGSSSPWAEGPRLSFACEFQRKAEPPFNQPLLSPIKPLTFEQRLWLIGKQILQYKAMYNLPPILNALGRRFTRSFSEPNSQA